MKLKQASYPYLAWSGLFIVLPFLLIVYFAFTDMQGEFSMANLVVSGKFSAVFVKSIWLAAVSPGLCFLIGYPVA